jgi:hypothetical protein
MRDTIELVGNITAETDKAVLFDGVWLPRSQIEIFLNEPIPGTDTVVAPEWLAIEKELV